MAHDFKHLRAEHRFDLRPLVDPPPALIGAFAFNTVAFNDGGQMIALAKLVVVFQQALSFIKSEAGIDRG